MAPPDHALLGAQWLHARTLEFDRNGGDIQHRSALRVMTPQLGATRGRKPRRNEHATATSRATAQPARPSATSRAASATSAVAGACASACAVND